MSESIVANIGLEVHVQLNTESKMFCGCSTAFEAEPNAQVCPVCLGYPGSLPVPNRLAVEKTVLAGLMLDCRIRNFSKFDRKSYFYPDMPKNYQISQYDLPLCEGGVVRAVVDGEEKAFALTRIHLEEDTARNQHYAGGSGVDFNRAGTPLMEIVSEPVMTSPDDAMAYLVALKQMMLYAGVSNCNLEQGNMRCDVNCSVRRSEDPNLGTKTELKNLNTFKGVHAALTYEIRRQKECLRTGEPIVQETRRWDVDQGITTSMRSKEDAHDYRYFPDPDLLPIELADAEIDVLREALPEAPAARARRYEEAHGLPAYDAGVLVSDKALADFYEATTSLGAEPKQVSNWLMTELLRLVSESEVEIGACKLTPESLAGLLGLVADKTLNSNSAKDVFAELFEKGGDPAEIVKTRGLVQVSDTGALEGFVDQAIEANEKSVADYRAGKKAALQFLMGQVMKASRGKANPQAVMEMLRNRLD